MRRGGAQAVVYRKFFKSAWLSDALLPLIKIGLLHPTRRKTCSRHSTTYRHFLRTACRRTNLRRNSYFHIRGYRRGCLSGSRFSRLEHGDITTEPGCTKMTYQQAWKAYLSSAAHARGDGRLAVLDSGDPASKTRSPRGVARPSDRSAHLNSRAT